MLMQRETQWLTLTEAARNLGVNVKTLKRIIRDKKVSTKRNILNLREVLVNMDELYSAINEG